MQPRLSGGGFGFIAFPAEFREDSELIAGARGAALVAGLPKYAPLPYERSLRLRRVADLRKQKNKRPDELLARPAQEKICFSTYRARFRPITKTPIRPDPSRIMVAGSGTDGLGEAVIDAEYDVEIARPAVISDSSI